MLILLSLFIILLNIVNVYYKDSFYTIKYQKETIQLISIRSYCAIGVILTGFHNPTTTYLLAELYYNWYFAPFYRLYYNLNIWHFENFTTPDEFIFSAITNPTTSNFSLFINYIKTGDIPFEWSNILNLSKFDVVFQKNLNSIFLTDEISIVFIELTILLCFLCQLYVKNEKNWDKLFLLINWLAFFLVLVFSLNNLLGFYICFEATLIPMFFLVGLYGSRERKIRAAYLLLFFTLFGSVFFLLGIIYVYSLTGSLNISFLTHMWTFTETEQIFLWFSFFLAFAIKMPLFPFHIWLPEAHVEAPAVGSVLLAGILLKLGVYGIIRLNLSMFPLGTAYFEPVVWVLAVMGIIYTSLTAIRQVDIKRIIAYSSVAHMNLIMIGLISNTVIGIQGAILQSFSHGLVSSALFFLIGMLYSRFHSRLVFYYSGLVHVMPRYVSFLLFFTLANIALPGTSNFTGEFLLLLGTFQHNFIIASSCASGVVFCGMYSLWAFNRMCFGNLKDYYLITFYDLKCEEPRILFILALFTLYFGLFPSRMLSFLLPAILNLIY